MVNLLIKLAVVGLIFGVIAYDVVAHRMGPVDRARSAGRSGGNIGY